MQGIANARSKLAQAHFLSVGNKKESPGNSLYDLVFYESGRQDSNLRPSAPKAQEMFLRDS